MPGIGHTGVRCCDDAESEKVHEKESGIDQEEGAVSHVSNLLKPWRISGGCLRNSPFYLQALTFFLADKKAGYADRILFTGGSNEFLQSKM